MFCTDEITKIFIEVDDFCKEFSNEIANLKLLSLPSDKKRRKRPSRLSDSEIITILICFHLGAHKTFKHYYLQIVCQYWSAMFPDLVSYNRFIELQQKTFVVFALFMKKRCLGKCTGISFMDSTTLKVCRNQRIHNHKVLKDIAARGKSSMVGFMVLNSIWYVMRKGNYYHFI